MNFGRPLPCRYQTDLAMAYFGFPRGNHLSTKGLEAVCRTAHRYRQRLGMLLDSYEI